MPRSACHLCIVLAEEELLTQHVGLELVDGKLVSL